MRFVTLFLKTENVHLLKDVGMIPYFLMKEHGADSTVVTYRNDDSYGYADDEVRGLKLEFVRPSGYGREIDGIIYLAKNARKIDMLNIYHLNLSSYLYETVYRLFNRHGRIYLKLDMNPTGLINCLRKTPVGMIKRATIRRSDIASVETTAMYRRLKRFFGDKILYVPNGCYIGGEEEGSTVKKENVILTVGNLGTYEKATDVLLEAFAGYVKESEGSDWRLRLVGSVDEGFRPFIDGYFVRYPFLKGRVTFTGRITDKGKLNEEYARAKVFTLPSLSESFGIVLVEAAMKGCYLITSDMVPAGYDVSDKCKNGMQVAAGDIEGLRKAFKETCDKDRDWDDIAKRTAAHARTAFDWSTIVSGLNEHL